MLICYGRDLPTTSGRRIYSKALLFLITRQETLRNLTTEETFTQSLKMDVSKILEGKRVEKQPKNSAPLQTKHTIWMSNRCDSNPMELMKSGGKGEGTIGSRTNTRRKTVILLQVDTREGERQVSNGETNLFLLPQPGHMYQFPKLRHVYLYWMAGESTLGVK